MIHIYFTIFIGLLENGRQKILNALYVSNISKKTSKNQFFVDEINHSDTQKVKKKRKGKRKMGYFYEDSEHRRKERKEKLRYLSQLRETQKFSIVCFIARMTRKKLFSSIRREDPQYNVKLSGSTVGNKRLDN